MGRGFYLLTNDLSKSKDLKHFWDIADFLRTMRGGFFLRKKPLEEVPPVYTHSPNAIGHRNGATGRVSEDR
jgi:hypothetical protein